METTINQDTKCTTRNQDDGQSVRRKAVQQVKLTSCALLAICWFSHFASIDKARGDRANRDEFIHDSMKYDLLTNGTAFGAYASSGANISQRWANVSNQDKRERQEEDHGRDVNFAFLLAFTALGIFFIAAPKGKQLVDNYIEHGLK